jgi:23S rRNA (cytidine1920-2'-O)/16S rRNA (cytidine1409-2'-O)-methyltransferase
LSPKQRARFVALSGLMRRRFPEVDEPEELISGGLVLVDGAPVSSPRAFVRADAAIKIVRPKPLRGTAKLAHAIERFGIYVTGLVAVDLGASAGGFTKALLDAGAARVYAVDAGVGQLRGWLRADPRVVNLEGTNLGRLTDELVPECVDLVTMDLSYLAVAKAAPQVDHLQLSSGAHLVALVKPTFELHASRLAVQPEQVVAAADAAERALQGAGWQIADRAQSPVRGSRGAVEVLLYARRLGPDFKPAP